MQARPTGTVTFLFTDIEGSTKLWKQNADAMRPALARHDILLRDAIETVGGYVFKTVGDAFCAAFSTAPEALQAALGNEEAAARGKALNGAGVLARLQGDDARAQALYAESLSIRRQLGDLEGISEGLEEMAGVALGQGDPERAARMCGASAALNASIGSPLSPSEQERLDKTLAGAAALVGEAGFAAAWDARRAMTVEQAVDYALEGNTE